MKGVLVGAFSAAFLTLSHGQEIVLNSRADVYASQFSSPYMSDQVSRNTFGGQVLIPTKVSAFENYGTGASSSYVIGSEGVMHAYATSKYPFDSDYADGNFADSDCKVNDYDTVTVDSATLAFGTPVTVFFNLGTDGTVDAPIVDQGGAINAYGATSLVVTPPAGDQLNVWGSETVSGSYTISGRVVTTVGATLGMAYSLEAYTIVYAYSPFYHEITSDFANTAVLTATTDNSAAYLVSASGYNYSAVPEPGGIAALGFGLASFLGIRKGRRRRR